MVKDLPPPPLDSRETLRCFLCVMLRREPGVPSLLDKSTTTEIDPSLLFYFETGSYQIPQAGFGLTLAQMVHGLWPFCLWLPKGCGDRSMLAGPASNAVSTEERENQFYFNFNEAF